MENGPGTIDRRRHVFVVSDATGETCETVVKSALAQFANVDVRLERFPQVRTETQIQEITDSHSQLEFQVKIH